MPYKVSNLNGTFQQQYEADPRIVAALAARQQADQVPIYSPGQGVARALSKMLDAYTQKQIQGEYQQKQSDQNSAIADVLAPPDAPAVPAMNAQVNLQGAAPDPTTGISAGAGPLDVSTPAIAQQDNPNRSRISALLNSGLISQDNPSVSAAMMKSVGLGEPDAPIKGQPGDTFLDPHTYKPLASIPQKNDPNKPFNEDGTPNTAYQQYEAGSKPPPMRTIQRGTDSVDQQYDAGTKQWVDISKGPKFKPDSPTENFSPPTMIGFSGPDGEEVQKAAIYNKRTGQYIDAGTMQPITNPQNLRIIGNSTGGARSQAAISRILTNAEDATSGIENLSNISSNASGGLYKNLETTPLSALSRTVTPQEVQDTQATIAGLSRAMGGLATGGLAVDENVMKSYEGLNLNTGDSYVTKMRKLAEMRQQSTNALDVQSVSPILSNDQRKKAATLSDRIKKAIPWTVQDVQALENSQNPNTSLRDLSMQKLKPGGAGSAPVQITGDADYAKLPSGSVFIGPDGHQRRKP